MTCLSAVQNMKKLLHNNSATFDAKIRGETWEWVETQLLKRNPLLDRKNSPGQKPPALKICLPFLHAKVVDWLSLTFLGGFFPGGFFLGWLFIRVNFFECLFSGLLLLLFFLEWSFSGWLLSTWIFLGILKLYQKDLMVVL